MRVKRTVALMGVLAVSIGGCATSEEWQAWHSHPTHFASGQHMSFSVRNREGRAPRVVRSDITLASDQGWWGRAITVSQEQILER
jgi:hypothetical protein